MTPSTALAHVLDAVAAEAPEAVARGRAALARALAWTATTAWPEVAWSFSDLADGAPVELVWRPGRPGLFWTVEPAAPEWPVRRRLARALTLARAGGARFDAGARALARDAALAAAAPWPVWVGGRHDASSDAYKLYVLTPPSLGASPPGVACVLGQLRGEDRLTMLGLAPGRGIELYWTRPVRAPGDRWRLSAAASAAPLATRLDAALADWTGHGLDDPAGGRLGLSLHLAPDGAPVALAAFMRVGAAGGSDRVRARMLAAGGDRNPALAGLWAAGRLRPMLLTLAATVEAVTPAIGFRIAA